MINAVVLRFPLAPATGGTVSMLNGSTFAYKINSSVTPSVGADLQLVAGDLLIADGQTFVVGLKTSRLARRVCPASALA